MKPDGDVMSRRSIILSSETFVESYLQVIVRSFESVLVKQTDGGYKSFLHFFLEEGRRFEIAQLPEPFQLGYAKQCFLNSRELVIRNRERFVYIEGFAGRHLPVHHAWIYDLELGVCYDPTWENCLDQDYFGVMFDTNFLLSYKQRFPVNISNATLTEDYGNRFPVLSGRVPREEWIYRGEPCR